VEGEDRDNEAGGCDGDGGCEEDFGVVSAFAVEVSEGQRGGGGSVGGEEELAVGMESREGFGGGEVIAEEVEADGAFAAALAFLAAGFLKGKVKPGECVEVAGGEGEGLGAGQVGFGADVVGVAEEFTAALAEELKVGVHRGGVYASGG